MLHDNIKFLRAKTNLSQTELANLLGVSHGSISYYESGAREPNAITVILYARVFGIFVEELCGELKKETRDKFNTQCIVINPDSLDARRFGVQAVENAKCMIKDLRDDLQHRVTQKELSKRVGISIKSIQNYEGERQKCIPGIEKATRIADALLVIVEELYQV